jgi:hypothetical protein
MLLTDLQQHFINNNVSHSYRHPDLDHDIYENRINGAFITIPINEEEIPDEFVSMLCKTLGIENQLGLPHRP